MGQSHASARWIVRGTQRVNRSDFCEEEFARRRCARTEGKKNRLASLAAFEGKRKFTRWSERNILCRPTISLEVWAPCLASP